MKKWLFLIICFFLFIGSPMAYIPEVVITSSRCITASDNKITIPMKAITTTDGEFAVLNRAIEDEDELTISNSYLLGKIDHYDSYEITINNIKSSYIYKLFINKTIDENGQSGVYYVIGKDSELKKGEQLISFDVEVSFTQSVPNKIHILGSDIAIASEEVCEEVNDSFTDMVRTEVFVKNGTDYSLVYILIIFFLIMICLLETLVLIRKRNK